MLKRLVLNIFFLLLSWSVSAQIYRFKHITTDDGLPTNYIQCILQDKQGFMWFGTQSGLARYDGYNIVVYKNSVYDKKSISSSDISTLYQHSDGKIYIGTRNNGINVFNPLDRSFEKIPTTGPNDNVLSDPRIIGIYKEDDNNLWIGTNNGLNLYNIKTKKVRHINFPEEGSGPIYCVYKYRDKVLVGTSEKGIWELDKGYNAKKINLIQNEMFNVDLAYASRVAKFEEYAGKLYLASQGEGLILLNPETYEIEKVRKVSVNADDPVNYIKSFVIKDNKAYANTKKGFIIYNLLSEKTELIRKGEEKKSLNDDDVTCFLLDENDNFWLGTFTGGLNVFFGQTQKFPNLPKETSDEFLQTYSIYADKGDKIWVGGDKFLKTLDLKSLETTDFSKVVGANYALSISGDDKDNIWIGTWGGPGLIKYNKNTKKSEEVLPQKFAGLSVLTQFVDESGRLLIGTLGEGMIIYKPGKGEEQSFSLNEGINSNITFIYQDSEKNYWLASAGGGAFFIPKGKFSDKKNIVNFKFNESKNSIASNTIYHIYEDPSKNIWFATESGVSKYDRKVNQFTNYKEEDGLADNFVLSILPDSAGNLWMSTNRGIVKFNPNMANINGSAFRGYDQKDGLLNNEYVQGAFCKRSNGELIFGSTNGINIFNPKKILENFHAPPVYVVSYKRSSKDVAVDTAISFKKVLQLSWKENYFQFEVAALDYNDPSKNKYMYILEGYDQHWSEPTDVRYVSYTELPGGDYIFKVKAANNDGVWNETPYEIHIKVIPPFWKTLWFYIIVSILGLVGIVLFTQYRTRAIKKENKILEQKVEERTKELAEKNRDITASIQYAKRIQEAILPDKNFIFSKLQNSFILYKPKDIVSGDFYWFAVKDDHKIIAVVDCTGHGVPGAFMSMIGHNILNQIVQQNGVTDPGEILNRLHTGIQDALKQGRNEINTNDGMDVSILSINEKTQKVTFAGAFRSLVIVRADSSLEKVDGNKFPVGGAQLDKARTFNSRDVVLQKSDTVYMFSDGYADQFGGDRGKKFMVKHFHDLLSSIHQKDLPEQKAILEQAFEQWRGNHEQVDDVLVVGVRF